MSWATLGYRAKSWRVIHAAWSQAGLASLAYLWACALTGRRDRRLAAALGLLSAEGVGLLIGRGDCPMAPLQARFGDPVPFFELVLPPRAARAAVPVLAVATVAGMLGVALRAPRSRHRTRR